MIFVCHEELYIPRTSVLLDNKMFFGPSSRYKHNVKYAQVPHYIWTF